MQVSKLRVIGSSKRELIEYLVGEITFSYSRDFGDTTIISGEEYRLRISSTQLYFIVLNSSDDHLYIEIVCGGGGEGLLQIAWGSEKAFIKRAEKCIADFCLKNKVKLEKAE